MILMNLEDLILILIKKTGLSRNEILELVNKLKSEKNYSVSDKKALIILAKSLCIEL